MPAGRQTSRLSADRDARNTDYKQVFEEMMRQGAKRTTTDKQAYMQTQRQMNIDRYKQTDISTKSDRHTGGQSLDKAGPNQILTQRRTHRLGQTMKQTDTNTHSHSNNTSLGVYLFRGFHIGLVG